MEALQEDSSVPRTGTHHVWASPRAPPSRASWDPIRGVSKVGAPCCAGTARQGLLRLPLVVAVPQVTRVRSECGLDSVFQGLLCLNKVQRSKE